MDTKRIGTVICVLMIAPWLTFLPMVILADLNYFDGAQQVLNCCMFLHTLILYLSFRFNRKVFADIWGGEHRTRFSETGLMMTTIMMYTFAGFAVADMLPSSLAPMVEWSAILVPFFGVPLLFSRLLRIVAAFEREKQGS